MRIFKGIAIIGTLLLIAAAVQPVLASCGSATLLGTNDQGEKSFIWNETIFTPSYYAGYAQFDTNPPWSANFSGQWWALGSGDPAPGAGDDSNIWTVDNWTYYYANTAYGYFYGGEMFGGWGQAAVIDGCILNNATGCPCILLTDNGPDSSAFALLAGQRDATGNTWYNQPGTDGAGNNGPIIMTATPNPVIVSSVKAGTGVNLQVQVSPLAGGVYQKDGCDCTAGLQYRVLAQELPQGSAPPSTRDASQWTAISADTPLGAVADASAACDVAADVDLYVATELVFDPASGGGFSGGVVSANSTRINCGANPTLADPTNVRPRVRPTQPMTPRGGRGK